MTCFLLTAWWQKVPWDSAVSAWVFEWVTGWRRALSAHHLTYTGHNKPLLNHWGFWRVFQQTRLNTKTDQISWTQVWLVLFQQYMRIFVKIKPKTHQFWGYTQYLSTFIAESIKASPVTIHRHYRGYLMFLWTVLSTISQASVLLCLKACSNWRSTLNLAVGQANST